jgi:sigma-B regulation protein RsbU (phosphoserine phosphatase)
MDQTISQSLFEQLDERRFALRRAIDEVGSSSDLVRLLADVDRAIERLGTNAFGKCVACEGYMTDAEMLESPLRRYCLCELSTQQQRELQRDLDLAWEVQASLLPQQGLKFAGWQTHYRYLPAGPVSGDYCDLLTLPAQGGWLYFLVGDVSGKGIAASYLMAHISALIRRSLDVPLPVACLVEIVNRHLSERSSDSHFVTLIAGRAHRSGRVEICNAGHCQPIIVRPAEAFALNSSGLPIGVLDQADSQTSVVQMAPGETLLLYTDGMSEARNEADEMFGAERMRQTAFANRELSTGPFVAACLGAVARFQASAAPQDDVTVLALRRLEQ